MTLELTNTYRQYKQDTKAFLCWLASTAAGHGWKWHPSQQTQGRDGELEQTVTGATEPSPPLVADNGQDAPNTKSRKKKKKPASASAPPLAAAAAANPAGAPATHAVPLPDFIPMAELIASKSRSTEGKGPSSISQTLDRVIRLREAFAVLLDHAAATADPESDKTHSHFVAVLKQCRAILGASSVPTTSMPTTADKPTTTRQRLTSAFAALKVYEPSESFLTAPPVTNPSAVNYVLAEDEANPNRRSPCHICRPSPRLARPPGRSRQALARQLRLGLVGGAGGVGRGRSSQHGHRLGAPLGERRRALAEQRWKGRGAAHTPLPDCRGR